MWENNNKSRSKDKERFNLIKDVVFTADELVEKFNLRYNSVLFWITVKKHSGLIEQCGKIGKTKQWRLTEKAKVEFLEKQDILNNNEILPQV
ncbi:MAG: hypothetical protein AABY22_25055 [Nanoarchaeota archaeon]